MVLENHRSRSQTSHLRAVIYEFVVIIWQKMIAQRSDWPNSNEVQPSFVTLTVILERAF